VFKSFRSGASAASPPTSSRAPDVNDHRRLGSLGKHLRLTVELALKLICTFSKIAWAVLDVNQ
jgi:hypothetical protein